MISFAALALAAAAAQPPMEIAVDLREAPLRVLHAALVLPASPGPLTLVYPKWIPGEHAPSGPVADLAGLRITAGGAALPWRRDPADLHAFQVTVPGGVQRIEVALDYLAPPPGQEGFSGASSQTPRLAMLAWNQVLLYPQGADVRTTRVRPSVRLPEGWKAGTALPVASAQGANLVFGEVTLETLVDSPVLAGRHLVEIAIGPPGGPPHLLVLAGDSAEAVVLPAAAKAHLDRLVAEAGALFGARPYGSYRFLVSLSDQVAHFGLEHHECSDDRLPERALLEPEAWLAAGPLLAHEFVHAWNGKHRRPASLVAADFQAPVTDELLWAYEGLTQYLGLVLSARSGLLGAGGLPDALAHQAGRMASRPGRRWRALGDTAVAAPLLYGARSEGSGWRRGVDFYPEGALVWLEVDALLRTESGGTRSLDDVLRAFHGGAGGAPSVRPYRLEDLVAALNAAWPRDWAALFRERVERIREAPPVEGLVLAGWRLAYGLEPTPLQKAWDESEQLLDLGPSLGLELGKEGRVSDVLPGSPAGLAGIPAGSRLLAVGGRAFTKERLADAVKASARGRPVELIVNDADFFLSARLDYRGGPRYPYLEREPSRADLLGAISAPRAPVPTRQAP